MVSGHAVFAVPGSLDTPTGGYAYDRRIIAELRQMGWSVDVLDLGDGFPRPCAEALAHAARLLSDVPQGRPVVVDGLAFGVMPDIAATLGQRCPVVALVHHPLAFETGIPAADAARFKASERAALAHTRAVIVTSNATAQLLAREYGVAPDRVTVAVPGVDATAPATGSKDGIVRLVAVGSIIPRKGYDILVAALATLRELNWHLTIAGARDRDPATAAKLAAEIAHMGMIDRVTVTGALPADRLAALYRGSDLFVLASRYEGFGMAYAEAIAHGLPVIGTTAGAIGEAAPASASILVPPDDVDALAQALRRLISNPDERGRLAICARAAARTLATWRDSAQRFSRAIEAVQ